MRLRCVIGGLVLALVGVALTGEDGTAQFGRFDPKDSSRSFDRYARSQGTKDYIEIDKVQPSPFDPEAANKLKAYAAKNGISGKMTKEQFATYYAAEVLPGLEEKMKGFGGGGFGGGKGGKGGKGGSFGGGGFGGGKGGFGKNPSATPGGEKSTETPKDAGGFGGGKGGFGGGKGGFGGGKGNRGNQSDEDRAKKWFRNMDRDRNDILEGDEISEEIREGMAKWDTNKDGKIQFDEFLVYAKERYAEERKIAEAKAAEEAKNNPGGTNPNTPPPPFTTIIEEKKLVIIRNDNLPKELPDWFKKLDTDKDAQIGLYEWKAGGKDLDEFRKYDRNGDGFLTVDEVLWYEKNKDRLAGVLPTNSTPTKTILTKDKPTTDGKDKGSSGRGGRGSRGSGPGKSKGM